MCNYISVVKLENFTTLNLIDCKKLRSMGLRNRNESFQPRIKFRHHQMDISISIKQNLNLEQIFEIEDETEVRTKKDIKFDKLEFASLYQLPCLMDFCPKGYHFVFLSLTLRVRE
ncbi:hypothetical protein J1N35_028222 [Gossypium stocksii]|uniref:NB-ARC domain-containing protein n=1 Tax=Gossypium stocksii TaxID=47602 RepID=A0A9D3ZSG9_9ROSI|nr:hypothetical protein J1N35_028222 [Gossypium stocksii]